MSGVRGIAAWSSLLALGLAAADTPAPPKPEAAVLSGTVVTLAEALKPLGLVADAEPTGRQVVLKAADGTITPLLCDEASRALFEDARLRDRGAELSVRRVAGLPFVQVTAVRVVEGDKLRTPEYYCDVCAIAVASPRICPCCQGPMELRMKPESPSW